MRTAVILGSIIISLGLGNWEPLTAKNAIALSILVVVFALWNLLDLVKKKSETKNE